MPNSVTRQALQGGLFRGKSKQVWDYLWSVSRGAVVPSRVVRRSRREIKAGSGLGSMVTVDAAIEHLVGIGLLAVKPAVGSLDGNEYEVFTPEEAAERISRYTSITSTPSVSSPTQNLVQLDIPESGTSSAAYSSLNSTRSGHPNTSFNTEDDDDTHTLLAYFSKTLLDGAGELVGGKLPVSEKERVLWNECACVLLDELKKAAENTQSISSVPAFLAAHLRRRFAQKQRTFRKPANGDSSQKPNSAVPPIALPQQGGPKQPPDNDNAGSKYTLEECRRYAEHLQKSGQGITNPGGYATTIYRTGEADSLIEKFINPEVPQDRDTARCPDCRGMGFFYPEGIDRGLVAKCKHPRLSDMLKIESQINQLRQLHLGDSSYQRSDLLDDLKFSCERENIGWDEDLIDHLLDE
ncbi:MAG TPA: hypothetical protein VFQ92_22545 [Blastocatellia bacterium]|nr:hypothetical protein [Blastocatellia bacterium]